MHWVSELPAVYMYLIIDPSSPEVVRFSLVDTGFRTAKEYTADHAGFLGALDNFLFPYEQLLFCKVLMQKWY